MPNYPLVTILVGTRPEAIKLAPVISCFNKSTLINTRLVLTGQHKEMVEQVMKLFKIEADKDLNIMRQDQTLAEITTNCIKGCCEEFENFRPDLVLVQGDTTSAFAACLSAFYKKLKIGYVESGLRTNDLMFPYPEEANRRMISQLSSLHFAPTNFAKNNLLKSNIKDNIYVTGNTSIDALNKFIEKSTLKFNELNIDFQNKVILLTMHRRENWSLGIKNVIKAIEKLIKLNPEIFFVVPMHKNKVVRDQFIFHLADNDKVLLLDTLDYDELIHIMRNCYLILTDSGGIQEEAPSFLKPVLILRKTTERQEAIISGTAKLVGTETKTIIDEVNLLIKNKNKYNDMISSVNPFGDGLASERILKITTNFLGLTNEEIHEFEF